MDYKTDRNRVQGLGSAHHGAGHWWAQRISSVALVPLTLLFLFPFAHALGQTHADVRAIYGNLWNALVAVLFLAVGFWHLAQGLQVVIEDYVPQKATRTALLLLNSLLCGALAVAGILAVAKMAFGV